MLGPVSTVLLDELRTKIRTRDVVVWLDKDATFTGFVQALKEEPGERRPFAIVDFRGSYLELILELGGLTREAHRPQLLLHLPGFTKEQVEASPLYEHLASGVSFRRGLDALVRDAAAGRVPPDTIDQFVGGGVSELSAAEDWLSNALGSTSDGLSGRLGMLAPSALLTDLRTGGKVATQLAADPSELAVVTAYFEAALGLSSTFRERWGHAQVGASDLPAMVAGWALCVEYVHDLSRPPRDAILEGIRSLPAAVVTANTALAAQLRSDHTFYQQIADETESLLPEEVNTSKATDLGKVDTFRFEESTILVAAIEALNEEQWVQVLAWCDLRLGDGSFWVKTSEARRASWQLVQGAARLGAAIHAAGTDLPKSAETLEQAVEAYVARGAAVDQAHRHLEQRRTALWHPQVAEYAALREGLDLLRKCWRAWADQWSRGFNGLCVAAGFVPQAPMQQRTVFDEVVLPFTRQPGTTAYFVVDALRFEMGVELARALEGMSATSVVVTPRLAELPSVTEVGMNVLAPVATAGRLQPDIRKSATGRYKIEGFNTGVFRVSSPDTRKRAMQDRVGGKKCPWLNLERVVSLGVTGLRKSIAEATLVVVHSEEIDKAGEKNVGTAVFPVVLQQLRAACHLLREAGVRRFVITSDHGFLLLDPLAMERQAHGRKIDPKRRHVLRSDGAERSGEVVVSLASLGYSNTEELHVAFPDSTAVFDTGRRPMSFVHGGNSFQERVIPVITMTHRGPAGGDMLTFAISAQAKEGVAGMHCLEAEVVIAQPGLFGGQPAVELTLQVPEDSTIQVELCDVRRGASLKGGAIVATVGERFEVFFRLHGKAETRVKVELHHPTRRASVEGYLVPTRFDVSALRGAPSPEPPEPTPSDNAWLQDLPVGGVRELFEHLLVHGSVTASEADVILGGPRKHRRFSAKFEEYVAIAKIDVVIEIKDGVKHYMKEGSS